MNIMDKRAVDILDRTSPCWGVCDFKDVSGRLLSCRAVGRLPENAVSVIVTLFPYYLGEERYEGANISRYAVVPDYHVAMKQRLESAARELRKIYPNEQFEAFCGSSPVSEVFAAELAGLGARGKNGLLITGKYGSWVFIGEIVTTMELPKTDLDVKPCLGCGLCVRACPTGALSENCFDKEKCLSHIGQQKGDIPKEYTAVMRSIGSAWGCDECQKVCPRNQNAAVTEIGEFVKNVRVKASVNDDLADRAYSWRGHDVIERNLKFLESEKEK